MLAEIRALESLKVELLALVFEPTDPDRLVAAVERFDREVAMAARAAAG